MRKSYKGTGRRAAGFFRLLLGIIVTLTLAAGSMALNTQPVQAIVVTPLAGYTQDLYECQSYTFQFGNAAPFCPGGTGPKTIYYGLAGIVPPDATWDMNTGVLTICPRLGSSAGGVLGVYTFVVWCTELDPTCTPTAWWSTNVANCVFTVKPPNAFTPLSITPVNYQVAWENIQFNMTLAATGCSTTPAYNWAVTGLPAGLSLTNATLGTIGGIPAPGTCGSWPVNVTCTDTSMCPTAGCCPPMSQTFTLIVDCYANYYALYSAVSGCDFEVACGPGLTSGQTQVWIDGNKEATLTGGQSEKFTSIPCEKHLVMVEKTLPGPNPDTSFECIGPNYQVVDDVNNYVYFNYAQKVSIQTRTDPGGAAQLPGTGSYAIGSIFSTSAPGVVETDLQNGIKYSFREFRLPDGTTRPNRELWFTVDRKGDVTGIFDTYYRLTLKSDKPYKVNETSWELKNSAAKYDLALQAVPMDGILGFLGAFWKPMNSSGEIQMNGPQMVEIGWAPDYTSPVIIIIIILLIVAAVVFVLLRKKKKQDGAVGTAVKSASTPRPAVETPAETAPVKPAASATPEKKAKLKAESRAEKKALSEAESKDKPNFCPKCGSSVDEGASFCKKCGNKL